MWIDSFCNAWTNLAYFDSKPTVLQLALMTTDALYFWPCCCSPLYLHHGLGQCISQSLSSALGVTAGVCLWHICVINNVLELLLLCMRDFQLIYKVDLRARTSPVCWLHLESILFNKEESTHSGCRLSCKERASWLSTAYYHLWLDM